MHRARGGGGGGTWGTDRRHRPLTQTLPKTRHKLIPGDPVAATHLQTSDRGYTDPTPCPDLRRQETAATAPQHSDDPSCHSGPPTVLRRRRQPSPSFYPQLPAPPTYPGGFRGTGGSLSVGLERRSAARSTSSRALTRTIRGSGGASNTCQWRALKEPRSPSAPQPTSRVQPVRSGRLPAQLAYFGQVSVTDPAEMLAVATSHLQPGRKLAKKIIDLTFFHCGLIS
ncbi:uncharacterized protein [Notamacropus eugenii]|uniref:uncharacterized protein n=1 Tax=Notamacropus eugenii TaxID=9315 RepID=UPI003B683D72